jgi:hypothetical protein
VLPLWWIESLFEVFYRLLLCVAVPYVKFVRRDCMAPAGTTVEGQHIVSNTASGNTRGKTCYKCHLEGHVSRKRSARRFIDAASSRLHVNVLS